MSKIVAGEAYRIDEKLPPPNVRVLVSCVFLDGAGDEFVEMSWRMDNGEWEITAPGNDYVRPFKVLAWMPLPRPFAF